MRKALTRAQAKELLEKRIKDAGGLRALARSHDVHPSVISLARVAGTSLSPQAAEILGLEKTEEVYVVKKVVNP